MSDLRKQILKSPEMEGGENISDKFKKLKNTALNHVNDISSELKKHYDGAKGAVSESSDEEELKNKLANHYDKVKELGTTNVKKITDFYNTYKSLLPKKFQAGGTEESTELNYSNELSKNQYDKLKIDYHDLIQSVNKIDRSITKLIGGTTSSNVNENNQKYKDMIIQRRILLEGIKDLEMKYNSIAGGDNERLDYAIELIRKDKQLRVGGSSKGLKFELDDATKNVFNTNMQLKGASDSLGDLKNILSSKLGNQNGGNVTSEFNFNRLHNTPIIQENTNQVGGSSDTVSKESLIEKSKKVSDQYLKLIEKIKQKENILLGLEGGNPVLSELDQFVNELHEVIKTNHVYNTRLTGGISKNDMTVINSGLSNLKNKYQAYEHRFKEISKLGEKEYNNNLKAGTRSIGDSSSNSELVETKRELLKNKLLLLDGNLKSAIQSNIIGGHELDYIGKNINSFNNIESTYDLDVLGGYDNEIENMLDIVNIGQKGGSPISGIGDDGTHRRWLLYQVLYHYRLEHPEGSSEYNQVLNDLIGYAERDDSDWGGSNRGRDDLSRRGNLDYSCQISFKDHLAKRNKRGDRTGDEERIEDVCKPSDSIKKDPAFLEIWNSIIRTYKPGLRPPPLSPPISRAPVPVSSGPSGPSALDDLRAQLNLVLNFMPIFNTFKTTIEKRMSELSPDKIEEIIRNFLDKIPPFLQIRHVNGLENILKSFQDEINALKSRPIGSTGSTGPTSTVPSLSTIDVDRIVNSKIDELNRSLSQMRGYLESLINELKSRIDILESRVDILEGTVGTLNSSITSISLNYDSIIKEITDSLALDTVDTATKDGHIENLRTFSYYIGDYLDKLGLIDTKDSFSKFRSDIDELRDKLSTLESSIASIAASASTAATAATGPTGPSYVGFETKLENTKEKIKEIYKKIKELHTNILELVTRAETAASKATTEADRAERAAKRAEDASSSISSISSTPPSSSSVTPSSSSPSSPKSSKSNPQKIIINNKHKINIPIDEILNKLLLLAKPTIGTTTPVTPVATIDTATPVASENSSINYEETIEDKLKRQAEEEKNLIRVLREILFKSYSIKTSVLGLDPKSRNITYTGQPVTSNRPASGPASGPASSSLRGGNYNSISSIINSIKNKTGYRETSNNTYTGGADYIDKLTEYITNLKTSLSEIKENLNDNEFDKKAEYIIELDNIIRDLDKPENNPSDNSKSNSFLSRIFKSNKKPISSVLLPPDSDTGAYLPPDPDSSDEISSAPNPLYTRNTAPAPAADASEAPAPALATSTLLVDPSEESVLAAATLLDDSADETGPPDTNNYLKKEGDYWVYTDKYIKISNKEETPFPEGWIARIRRKTGNILYKNETDKTRKWDFEKNEPIYEETGGYFRGGIAKFANKLKEIPTLLAELKLIVDTINFDKINNKILSTNVDSSDIENLLDEIKTKTDKVKEIKEDIIKYFKFQGQNELIDIFNSSHLIKTKIDTIKNEIKQKLKKYSIGRDSTNYKYMLMTMNRIEFAIIFYIQLIKYALIDEASINDFNLNIIKIIDELNINTDINTLFDQFNAYTVVHSESTNRLNALNIINNINTIVQVQIYNFNNVLAKNAEEQKVEEQKIELIASIHTNGFQKNDKIKEMISSIENKLDKTQEIYKDQMYYLENIDKLHTTKISDTKQAIIIAENPPISTDAVNISSPVLTAEDTKNKLKEDAEGKVAEARAEINTINLGDPVDQNKLAAATVKLVSAESVVTFLNSGTNTKLLKYDSQSISTMMQSISKYFDTYDKCKTEINKKINKHIALLELSEKKINILSEVLCEKTLDEMPIITFENNQGLIGNPLSKRIPIMGNVVDYNYEKGETILTIHGNDGKPIKKKLKYCKLNIIEDKKEKKENDEAEAIAIASKLGFTNDTPIICKKNPSIIERFWNGMKGNSVEGTINKMSLKRPRLREPFVQVTLSSRKTIEGENANDETKFNINDCENAYHLTLDKMNKKRQNKHIVKQLQKLKQISNEIDELDSKKPDYELKLKLLNRTYERISDETKTLIENRDNGITTTATKDPTQIAVDEQEEAKLEKKLQISKLEQNVDDLRDKRFELETALKKVNPKYYELIHPEKTDISRLKLGNAVVGGTKMIQRAGYITPVDPEINLNVILEESKSLLNRIKH